MAATVTLKIWHGGLFVVDKNREMKYMGGEARTFTVDAEELTLGYLHQLVKECEDYVTVEGIYYLIEGHSFGEGLVELENDSDVEQMADVGVLCSLKRKKIPDPELAHTPDPDLDHTPNPGPATTSKKAKQTATTSKQKSPKPPPVSKNKKPKPVTTTATDSTLHKPPLVSKNKKSNPVTAATTDSPQKPPPVSKNKKPKGVATVANDSPPQNKSIIVTAVPEDYEWEDNRPESPLTLKQLLGENLGSDFESGSDFEYDPSSPSESSGGSSWTQEVVDDSVEDAEGKLQDLNWEDDLEEEVIEDDVGDSSDEESQQARENVRGFNKQIVQLAKQVQKDAEKGIFAAQGVLQEPRSASASAGGDESGYQSDYVVSDEEIETPLGSGDEEEKERKKVNRELLVAGDTDFSVFHWKVGQRFPTRKEVKEEIAKYAVMQGRDLSICISDNSRQQRVGVKYSEGCPFRVYGSWDSRRASFVVKSVTGQHTCLRNMDRIKQCKSNWMAEQLLDLFKARPQWPAKEIIDCIRVGFRVVVKKQFAYKVEYKAHKLLHGSMKQHYAKLADINDAYDELEKADEAAALSFKRYNPKCFCRAYMSTSCKADVITSNLAETFNGYIIHARNKHLVDMMEDIRSQLMQRLVVKRKEMQQHTGLLCPRIQERLEKKSMKLLSVEVNMPLDPPPIKVGPGRPRKNRVKDPHENPKKQGKLTRHGIEMTCSSCQRKGHNKRSCPNKGSTSAPAPPKPKRKMGRPKSAGEATISTVHMYESQVHHDNTVELGRIGKGGKVAYTGRGRGRGAAAGSIQASTSGKGRGRGRGKGRGRGGLPQGIGVLFGSDGSMMTNVMPMSGQPVAGPPTEDNINVSQGGSNQIIGSQNSTL
ncbi:Large tegument protein deneddylase [Bienertia sinuspersici]